MRRLAVWSLAPMAAVLVALGGCNASSAGTPSASGTGSAVPDGGGVAVPSTRISDLVTANTRQVCDQINQAISENASVFGADLGNLAGHLAGGNSTEAARSKTDALTHLAALATTIRTAAGAADDPEVRAAARDTANQITALAADPKLLNGVKSAGDLAPVIEKLTRATDSMNKVCV